MKKMRMVLAVLALGFLVSSCYGPFELTRKLWKWNGSVGDKWVNEGVFLVLNVVVPVYGVASFVDAVVLNSVQFWTGKSLLEGKATIKEGNLEAVLTPAGDGRVLRLDISRNGKIVETAVIKPALDGSMQASTLDGSKLVSRTCEDGTVEVSRSDGTLVASYPATAAKQYLQ